MYVLICLGSVSANVDQKTSICKTFYVFDVNCINEVEHAKKKAELRVRSDDLLVSK